MGKDGWCDVYRVLYNATPLSMAGYKKTLYNRNELKTVGRLLIETDQPDVAL